MAKARRLTVAGLTGRAYLRFQDVANHDSNFQGVLVNGNLSVERGQGGSVYGFGATSDHWRMFTTIITPDDFPTLFYWHGCNSYGWWQLEGFPLIEFGPYGEGPRDGEVPLRVDATMPPDKLLLPEGVMGTKFP